MVQSIHVYGIRPSNEKWKLMKAIWDACESGGVPVPVLVDQFFNNERPDPAGVLLELRAPIVQEWYDVDMKLGVEVDISKLPDDIKIVRFVHSY